MLSDDPTDWKYNRLIRAINRMYVIDRISFWKTPRDCNKSLGNVKITFKLGTEKVYCYTEDSHVLQALSIVMRDDGDTQ
jgi:hypothetical protein